MYPKSISQQRGSMLVIAIFTMVVLLLLAVSLQRMLVSSQQSIVYEVYGARAYNSAQSGIDHHLTLLFPTDDSDGSSRCTEQPTPPLPATELFGVSQVFSASGGLMNCRYQTQCETKRYQYGTRKVTYYRLNSLGTCQIGDIIVNRNLYVDAKPLR